MSTKKQDLSHLQLKKNIRKLASPEVAKSNQRFFKTGKGDYGYGDKFLGIRVPEIRKLAKKYTSLSLEITPDSD